MSTIEYFRQWRAKNRAKVSEYARKWAEDNPEKISEYMKKHYLKNTDKVLEKNRVYRLNNPDVEIAHHAINHAVASGDIIRPGICVKCGETRPVEGHHFDYQKPLDVVWLCHRCHMRIHREKK